MGTGVAGRAPGATTAATRQDRRALPAWLPHALAVTAVFAVLAPVAMRFTVGHFTATRADPVEGGYYQRLASAFLSGQLALEERPPADLVDAPNPWDPARFNEHRRYGLHDASLYNGRYFYYWGPSPVLTVVIPARLLGFTLTETDVGRGAMVAILAIAAAFAFLVARRLRLGPWTAGALALVAATPFSAWFQLTRLAVYEASILFGAAAAAGAAVCFLAGGRGLLLLGGLLSAVAMTARAEAGAVALVALALALPRKRRQELVRTLVFVGGPLALGLAALLLYNQLRFDSPFEFGQKYVLAGLDLHDHRLASPAYVPWSLYYYLFRWPGFSLRFPYFEDPPRLTGLPRDYLHFEPTFGALWTVPATVLVLALGAWLVVRRVRGQPTETPAEPSANGPPVAAVGGWLVAAAVAALLFDSYAIFHASQRFRLVYDVLFALGAVAVVGAALSLSAGSARRLLGVALAVVAAASLATTVLGAAHGVYPDGSSVGRSDVHRLTEWVRRRV